ncbi:hypothetical protein [Desulfosporosinus hippei]|uniref:hypothetical protein n=1 Tax=Desulfosporosinus hippei TaxID=569859 RepID=UPI00115FF79B|nr:hypothetical protein [Desulfosporosinus hippei]
MSRRNKRTWPLVPAMQAKFNLMREVFVPLDLQIVSIEYPGKYGYVGLDSPPLEYKKNYELWC